jgi:formate hydrogenlyase transcriptional activator
MPDDLISRRPRGARAVDALRVVSAATASVTGDDFFRALVASLAEFFDAKYAFVTECTDATLTRVRTLAFHADGYPSEDVEYDMAGTPCERVMTGGSCYYPTGLSARFPDQEGMASYLGVLVTGRGGQALGHLAVADDSPMPCGPRDVENLDIFAARAGMELERKRLDEELRASREELRAANLQLTRALDEIGALRDRLQDESRHLQEEIRREGMPDGMLGDTPPMRELARQIAQIGPADCTTLITGETGVGKELAARAIHAASPRNLRPMVKVNTAVMAGGLIESELFGHERGAFTGATERRTGRFELADGGTLLLDEIGELSVDAQAKLLRVLEEGEFERVGSSHTRKVDVRVIAATNRNLAEAVARGDFRADLYHRLNVVPVEVPPLRGRPDDVPALALHFLARARLRSGKPAVHISDEAMSALAGHSWPGNVRELSNVIERAVVLAKGDELRVDDFLLPPGSEWASSVGIAPNAASAPASEPASLREVERRHILHVLVGTSGVVAGEGGAAQLLGLPPSTLRSRMKKLGIALDRRPLDRPPAR